MTQLLGATNFIPYPSKLDLLCSWVVQVPQVHVPDQLHALVFSSAMQPVQKGARKVLCILVTRNYQPSIMLPCSTWPA